MKKTIAIVLLFVLGLCFSWADAESVITFSSVPWESDDITTFQILMDKGFLSREMPTKRNDDKAKYFVPNDELCFQPGADPEYQKVSLAIDMSETARGKIAGYPVKNIIPTFAYDGNYHLISVRVELIGADYESLRAKLTKAYGECKLYSIEEESIYSNIWMGENNSAVILYTELEGFDYTLLYGRTDAVDILKKCLEVAPDDINGL